jgi:hypothetical protein
MKPLEQNIREMILNITMGNDVLVMILKAQSAKTKIDKQDHIKLKIFCPVK